MAERTEDLCECGHIRGEHKTNRTTFPHPVTWGTCLSPIFAPGGTGDVISTCACRKFTAAALEHERQAA